MLFLGRREVEELLDLDELVDTLATAMAELSAGKASMPPRGAVNVPEREAMVGAMLGYVPATGALAAKLVSVFPGNARAGRETHSAVIVAIDPEDGTPAALMEGGYITAARTAAGSALATRLLARPESRVLAILGTGVQAWAHLRAIPRVAQIEEVVVAGRSPERTDELVGRAQKELGLPARAANGYRAALETADIVCATTHSAEPVIEREWLHEGMHINSVGLNWRGREIDAETVRDAAVFVESRQAALAQPPAMGANDLLWPIRDSVISADHIRGEIGELVLGTATGRTSSSEITLYKSVGVAVQDAAAAALVLRSAQEKGVGVAIDIER